MGNTQPNVVLGDDVPTAYEVESEKDDRHPLYNFLSYDNLNSLLKALTYLLDSSTIPKDIHEAMSVQV